VVLWVVVAMWVEVVLWTAVAIHADMAVCMNMAFPAEVVFQAAVAFRTAGAFHAEVAFREEVACWRDVVFWAKVPLKVEVELPLMDTQTCVCVSRVAANTLQCHSEKNGRHLFDFCKPLLGAIPSQPSPLDISKMYFSLWKTPGVPERMWSVNIEGSIS
jgi:hypothetical protein